MIDGIAVTGPSVFPKRTLLMKYVWYDGMTKVLWVWVIELLFTGTQMPQMELKCLPTKLKAMFGVSMLLHIPAQCSHLG